MAKLRDDEIRWILSLDAKGVQSELTGLSSKSIQLTNDNKKLTAELKQVDKWLKEAEKDMLKYSQAGDTTSQSYQRAKTSFDQLNQSAANLRQQIVNNNKAIKENDDMANQIIRTMRVEDMTMEQLKKRARELEIQLNKTSVAADPKAYNQLDNELNAVEKRMGELKNGGDETASMFSGTLAKGIVAVTAAIAIAKQGFKIFEEVMTSNRATGIEFNGMMNGLNNAMDYFKAALANMDFTNFIEGLKNAYGVGHQVSLMLEDIYDRDNSFKLTSAKEIAEIEELKTDLRDVNLSNKERLEIGNQIVERTKKMAEEEKKLHGDRLDAAKKLLVSQTNLTDAEIEYMTVNRNANEQDIQNIKKIKALEGDLLLLKKNAKTWEGYSNDGKNNYYVNKLKDTNAEIDQYNKLIGKLKNNYGLTDPKQYEIATNAIDKYYMADKKMVDNYINSRLLLEQVDIKTTRSLRMTQRTIDALTKKQNDGALGGSTPEQRQRTALNEFNKEMEIKYQEDLAEIKKQYRDGDIKTEADYKRKIFASDQANYALRKTSLEEFLKTPLDKKVRSDIEKEIATLETKRLDQEIKFQAELEKVILNANPVEKEKRAYEERLSAVGLFEKDKIVLMKEMAVAETEDEKNKIQQQLDLLDQYGIDREKLTAEQLQALELLEKQHQENLEKIELEAEARKKGKSEKDFENEFKGRREEMQLELNDLMQQAAAASGSGAFEAEMAVHLQRLKMINEEVDARTKAGLDIKRLLVQQGKEEAALTKTLQKEATTRYKSYSQYTTSLGTAMGNLLSGQEDGMKAFGSSLLDIFFDIISKIIETKIMEATAVAVAEQAKAAAIAAAMPDSVATFGASAAARTAAIGAIIMGALQVAKTVLKGMLTSKSSNTNTSSSSQKTGERVYSGFAEGGYHEGYTGDGSKYEVKGFFPDGQPYHAGEYIIPQEVLRMPAVTPIIRQIESARRSSSNKNPLPDGFADGGYHSDTPLNITGVDSSLIKEFISVMRDLKDKKLAINYYEFENAKKVVDTARAGASKR